MPFFRHILGLIHSQDNAALALSGCFFDERISRLSFFIRALFGEMGEYLLLKGQRVLPKRLLEAGFSFEYSTLETALRREYA